jgi:hypothetical protein
MWKTGTSPFPKSLQNRRQQIQDQNPGKNDLFDQTLSGKYDKHIEKGTDLIYEMGNTIKTELDPVIEESSNSIDTRLNSLPP